MRRRNQNNPPEAKKPTVEELDEMLNGPEPTIVVQPDGSIRAEHNPESFVKDANPDGVLTIPEGSEAGFLPTSTEDVKTPEATTAIIDMETGFLPTVSTELPNPQPIEDGCSVMGKDLNKYSALIIQGENSHPILQIGAVDEKEAYVLKLWLPDGKLVMHVDASGITYTPGSREEIANAFFEVRKVLEVASPWKPEPIKKVEA